MDFGHSYDGVRLKGIVLVATSVTIIFALSQSILVIPAFADPTLVKTITMPNPDVFGANPITNKVYVTNLFQKTVSVINGDTDNVIATIPVGNFPVGCGVNSVTNKIYVFNVHSNNTSIIDGTTDTVIDTINLGAKFQCELVDSVTNKLYFANNTSTLVLNGTTNSVIATIHATGGFALNPVTNKIYLTNQNRVYVIDGNTDTIKTTISVGSGAITTLINSATNKMYTLNHDESTVSVIDGATDSLIDTISVGDTPIAGAVDTLTNKILVSSLYSNPVLIDGSTDSVSDVPIGSDTIASMVFDPISNRIYATSFQDNFYAIDGNTGKPFVTIPIGYAGQPVINPATDKVYASSVFDNATYVISDSTKILVQQDSFVQRLAANSNEGKSPSLRVMAGNDHVLVYFNQTDLVPALTGKTLESAKLRLFITNNGNNWGPLGKTIEVHKSNDYWTEGNGWNLGNTIRGTGTGVTWNCARDGNITNFKPDCNIRSNGGNYNPNVSSSVLIKNLRTGWIDFDVTADVWDFVHGATSINLGWIIKKSDETTQGLVDFASRESPSNQPQLVLTFGS